jgi:hypothetical protein
VAATTSCGADGFGLVADCSGGTCEPIDASLDAGSLGEASTLPPADAARDGSEIGLGRSPLCAMSGCFPGLVTACVQTPLDDAGSDDATSQLDLPDGGDGGDEDADDADDAATLPVSDARGSADDASIIVGGNDALAPSIDANSGDVPPGVDAPSAADAMTSAEAAGSDAAVITHSCYVSPASNGGVVAACALAGPGGEGSACHDSRDCAAILACVQIDGAGVCRPFSCGLPPNCPLLSFYEVAPLIVAGVAIPGTVVPVCVPAVHCNLLQTPSDCAGGKVCAVIGNMGETSCVTPGTAKRDEGCDEMTLCAEGLVCAMRPDKTQNRCLQLCHIDQGNADQALTECPGGTCQGGNMALPAGFGICVGDNPDAG